jgi:hypothetical protein
VNSISQNVGNVKSGNAGNTPHSITAADDESVRNNTPGVKDAEETAQINEEIERVDLKTTNPAQATTRYMKIPCIGRRLPLQGTFYIDSVLMAFCFMQGGKTVPRPSGW